MFILTGWLTRSLTHSLNLGQSKQSGMCLPRVNIMQVSTIGILLYFALFCSGTAFGYFTVKDYNSLIIVLQNMSDADKRRLVKEVELLIGSSMQDVLLTFVKSEANCKQLLDVFRKFC